ncbi:MAG TPA: arylamine N-acetyltransferase, partial [Acidimicrobiales bacterium]|nr:arylamine N-acetyltransferase [Acidimicrobiales bacterium]
MTWLDRYFARLGLDGADTSLATLARAHVCSIPYENLDVRLGREIRLDRDALVAKLVDGGRGGYCYEHNTLFAHVLDELGVPFTRHLGRVRMTDNVSARPATHMVLVVDGCAVDVGFGAAVPLGPVPLGESVTYGPCTWSTTRVTTPEGEAAWQMSLFDMPMFTFTDVVSHPVDYVTPNHFSSTHPMSIFTQLTLVQRWRHDDVQVGLVDGVFKERRPDGTELDVRIDAADLGRVLREDFALTVTDDEV